MFTVAKGDCSFDIISVKYFSIFYSDYVAKMNYTTMNAVHLTYPALIVYPHNFFPCSMDNVNIYPPFQWNYHYF